jgi:hypothetical protein
MLGWAWTLVRLYKDIDHSTKLLPNKRIFIIHGCFLAFYLLVAAVIALITYWFEHTENVDTVLTLLGINDLLASLGDLLEVLTFFLVVKLMLPITQSDKENRSKF